MRAPSLCSRAKYYCVEPPSGILSGNGETGLTVVEIILDSIDLTDIPAGYLKRAIQIAERHGHSPARLYRKFSIAPDDLAASGARIPRSTYFDIVEHLVADLNIPGFGLQQGAAEKLSDHLFLSGAVVSASTVKQGLLTSVKYQNIFGIPTPYVVTFGPRISTIVCEKDEQTPLARWAVENVFAGWANFIHKSIGRKEFFSNVSFAFPDPGYRKIYDQVFGCPIRFSAKKNALQFPSQLLDEPFVSRNPLVHELCVRQIDEIIKKFNQEQSLVDKIEALLMNNMSALPNISTLASHLRMTERTLSRKLKQENTSYRRIVDNVRRRLAADFIGRTNLAPKEIGYNLAYTEPANFYHAFRRWFGCTPLQYRNKLRT